MTRSHRLLAASVLAAALVLAGALTLQPGGSSRRPAPDAAYAAARASTQAGDLARFLRFSGTGTVTVTPDTAQISVTATGEGDTAKEALDASSTDMEKIVARLKQLGVAEDDMQTGGVWSYRGWDTPRRYQASNTLNVTVRDVAKAGTLLGEATDAGASEVSGPSFSVADRRGAYRQALRQAIEDARAKADAAAAGMGVAVSGVVSVAEDGASSAPVMYAAADAARSSKAVPVQAGKLEVDATVTVTFSYS